MRKLDGYVPNDGNQDFWLPVSSEVIEFRIDLDRDIEPEFTEQNQLILPIVLSDSREVVLKQFGARPLVEQLHKILGEDLDTWDGKYIKVARPNKQLYKVEEILQNFTF